MSKEQYDRENGKHDFQASIKARGKAAKGLKQDLVSEVPMLYGQTAFAVPDEVINKAHQADMLRKNEGGVAPTRLYKKPPRTLIEKIVIWYVLIAIANAALFWLDEFIAWLAS